MRTSGVLMPISSLPSPYGIGTMGKSARKFVDFLVKGGQTYWQILPICPTSYGDSPYQSFSSFAGNPYFIDLDILCKENLLKKKECESFDWGTSEEYIDYGTMYVSRYALLHKAYARFVKNMPEDFSSFCEAEKDWLEDYTLFMALKDANDGKAWAQWDEKLRVRDAAALDEARKKYAEDIEFYKMLQYLFFKQWRELKAYANENGIEIIGDVPIYVAGDSADVWANPKQFYLDEDLNPIEVAGCPPDGFSADGQLWGNPLYDWDEHQRTGYRWWIARIRKQLRMVDKLRIDHFRGFEKYYAIPYGEKTAMHGHWRKGPGADLFRALQEALGKDLPIWAEDLGIITPKVEALRDAFGFPGMKVLQFAFGGTKDNELMPYRFRTDRCICYTGTHDNDTTLGWYQHLSPEAQDRIRRYLNTDGRMISWDMIRLAMSTTAQYSIYPVQDLLGFGSDCRMNTPGEPSGNWAFRFREDHLTREMAERLRAMTELFGRLPGKEAGDVSADPEDGTSDARESREAAGKKLPYDPYDPELIEEP